MFSFYGDISFGRSTGSKKKKPIKKKHANWFESCNATQLKELCKAAKLPVSGSKVVLAQRLMGLEAARTLGVNSQVYLKAQLTQKLLIKSGNKYDMVLRLLHAEFGTGQVKRAATDVVIDETTGREVQVLKKRKTTPSAKVIYTRVGKKMNAVTQKKYQSHYGSKDHSVDVYNLMRDLIKNHCIEEKIVDSDPLLAEEMGRAAFRAFEENWHVMESTGYEAQVFREALDCYADVLKVARPLMSSEQVESVVSLLESIEACVSGRCLAKRCEYDACVYYSTGKGSTEKAPWRDDSKYSVIRKKDENVIQQTILVAMPQYDKATRKTKSKGKLLDSELRNIAWMNGISLPQN